MPQRVHKLLPWVEMLSCATGESTLTLTPLICRCRIVPVESGSGVSRNQAYNMVSVYGDVVLVEPVGNADSSQNTDVIEKLQITIPLQK